jgi:hypothetical protein
MFRRRKPRTRCAKPWKKRARQRRLTLEPLEDRCMMAILTVNSAADNVTGGDNLVTLREAIIAANTDGPTDAGGTGSGFDMIEFAPALDGATINLTMGQLPTITTALSIDALPLAGGLTIDASGNDPTPAINEGNGSRIFEINDGNNATNVDVTLVGLRLTGGDVNGEGGAIGSFENLTARRLNIVDNHASGLFGHGGGIALNNATGSVTVSVTDSTVAMNDADVHGGGIAAFLNAGSVTIFGSTLSGNSAEEDGGGIEFASTSANLTVNNSTLYANAADNDGGGIDFSTTSGVLSITHSTISDNFSDANAGGAGTGGGIHRSGGTAAISHTILANFDNTGTAPDINTSTDLSINFSLVRLNTGSGLVAAPVGAPDADGNLIGSPGSAIDPMLAPLASNGGPTQTRALLPGSPAIDAGNPAAVAGVGGVPLNDQRGTPFGRIYAFNAVGPRIDIGAFEILPPPDPFEFNNTRATATVLGSDPFVTLQDLSISPAGDEDFFRYIAHDSGKLIVRTFFTHAGGDLDLEIQGASGNVIFVSQGSVDEELAIIPVVAQQTYFIHVYGFGGAVNSYSLEVENFPAPVPAPPDLASASDTGMMNDDNITADTTPTFRIQADLTNFSNAGISLLNQATIDPNNDGDASDSTLSGAGVFVTLVNLDTGAAVSGFANPVGTGATLWSFTPSAALADGEYFVSAAVQMVDFQQPQRANDRTQLSDPLTIVVDASVPGVEGIAIDMLTASDTGMLDDDNVTNKMQPAFQGIAPAGAKIRLFANGELVGQTVAGSDASDVGHAVGGIGGANDDGLGLWEITVEPLADNGYDIRLEIEDAAGNVTVFDPRFNDREQPIDIVIDTLEPNTPYLDLVDDTGRHDNDNITKDNTPQVTLTSTDPNINLAQLLFGDNLKFRIYDRFEGAGEFKLYDSALDTDVDAMNVPLDMFTALTFIQENLPEQFFALVGTNVAVLNVGGAGVLADGVHNLKLEVEDRAGNFSHDFLLEITIDTVTPPVSFGLPDGTNNVDGLAASSDSGVTTVPATYADRVTSDTTPTLWGRAEADTIVRLYLDRTDVGTLGVVDLDTDIFLGLTVAVPYDGNDAYPDGYWEITSTLDLNQIVGLPKDGLRRLLATAEDVAGNPMPVFPDDDPVINDGVATLQIFIDTQGPRITNVHLGPEIDYDLFDPKPSVNGPTPLVHSLFIDIRDFPTRLDQGGTDNDFLYAALVEDIAETIGNYDLVGDFVGRVVIQEVIVHFTTVTGGQAALASIELVFAQPLPDDRYTLTVRDNLVDPVGNRLDGESGASQPSDNPVFSSGDGVPGGNFVARFTVDTRPEIGVWAAGTVLIDTNGNFLFDPETIDFSNRDLTYTLGFASDYVFAGNFVLGAGATADGFDKLAAYGRVGNQWRFLIDVTNDGVPDHQFVSPTVNGIPVAGNFDGNAANGDEIAVFTGSSWFFDTNHDFIVDLGIASNYAGFPVAGDFDGDGDDDVGTYIASSGGNFFHIDINTAAAGAAISINGVANHGFRMGVPGLGTWGFPGVRERPVAADMNGDGVDDLGLWVPDGTAILPGDQGEWFFLLSDFNPRTGVPTQTVIDRIVSGGTVFFVPFSTTPFGNDLYARFGNSFSLPIVGNFDPPVSSGAAKSPVANTAARTTPAATPTPAVAAAPVVAASVGAASSVAVTTTALPVVKVAPAPIAVTVTSTPPPVALYVAPPESAPVRLAVPPIAAAATATIAPAATTFVADTTQAVWLSVPPLVPVATTFTAAPVVVAANNAKVTQATAATVNIAVVKSTTKTTKATTVKVPTPTKTVPVPVITATQSSVITGTAQKKTVTTTVVAAAPTTAVAPVAKVVSTAVVQAAKTTTITTPAAAPVATAVATQLLKAAKVAQIVTAAPSVAAKTAKTTVQAQPAAKTVVAKSAASIAASDIANASFGGLFNAAANDASIDSQTGNSILLEPAIADAAVVDLRLTLADFAHDAITADAESQFGDAAADEWHSTDPSADDLALEQAWESVVLGVS